MLQASQDSVNGSEVSRQSSFSKNLFPHYSEGNSLLGCLFFDACRKNNTTRNMEDIIITGANVWIDGKFVVADVSVHDRKISAIGNPMLQTFNGKSSTARANTSCRVWSICTCISANRDIPTRRPSAREAWQPQQEDSLSSAPCQISIPRPTTWKTSGVNST